MAPLPQLSSWLSSLILTPTAVQTSEERFKFGWLVESELYEAVKCMFGHIFNIYLILIWLDRIKHWNINKNVYYLYIFVW